MRKIFTIFLVLVSLLSCNKFKAESIEPETVLVSFEYSFVSGSMLTKSNNLYTPFYNDIVSGDLVAEDFHITLVETTTGETYEFSGKWKEKSLLSVKTGKYKITGTSTAAGDYIQNKCSLRFDSEIEIKSSDTCVVLPAMYDCFLLVFDNEIISEVFDCFNEYYELHDYYSQECKKFYQKNNTIYGFSYGLYNSSYGGSPQKQPALKVISKSGNIAKIFTKTLNFELGRYYIYNPVENSFSIPEMERGNI